MRLTARNYFLAHDFAHFPLFAWQFPHNNKTPLAKPRNSFKNNPEPLLYNLIFTLLFVDKSNKEDTMC